MNNKSTKILALEHAEKLASINIGVGGGHEIYYTSEVPGRLMGLNPKFKSLDKEGSLPMGGKGAIIGGTLLGLKGLVAPGTDAQGNKKGRLKQGFKGLVKGSVLGAGAEAGGRYLIDRFGKGAPVSAPKPVGALPSPTIIDV